MVVTLTKNSNNNGKTAYVVEHSHYDTEWLTGYQNNGARMVAVLAKTVRILEKNPDTYFVIDQVPLIEAVKNRTTPRKLRESYRDGGWVEVGNTLLAKIGWLRHRPQKDLYKKVKKLVGDGRIQIVGGSYVQPDTNLPSGESLVRQNTHGKKYFRDELGVDPRIAWNIDVFGQSAQLPQIMKKSGITAYVFSRGRSETDKKTRPSEFFWKGIDGTKILTHCMPEHYNKIFLRDDDNELKYNMEGFANIVCDGFNKQNVKKRIKELAKRLEKNAPTAATLLPVGSDLRFPHTYTSRLVKKYQKDGLDIKLSTPEEFFERVRKESETLETVRGEFNPVFEGCYSSRILLKQKNRECENLLLSAEKLATIASSFATGYVYPKTDLGHAWEGILYNQFHDIMCASIMDHSYKAAMARFDDSEKTARKIIGDASGRIAERINTQGRDGEPIVVFNTLSWDRSDAVRARVKRSSPGELTDSHGRTVSYRIVSELDDSVEIEFTAKTPSIGYSTYYLTDKKNKQPASEKELTRPATIENEYLKVRISPQGRIESIVDKKQKNKELLLGPAHAIKSIEDAGDTYFTKPGKLMSEFLPERVSVKRAGGASKSIIVEGTLGEYEKVRTQMTLYSGVPRLDFETRVQVKEYSADSEWKNHKVIVDFPLAGGDFYHQIPYGKIKSKDGIIPAQDYVSRENGASLINRGLPEHTINKDNGTVKLCLLRSFDKLSSDGSAAPKFETPLCREAGQTHTFQYAIAPERLAHTESRAYNNGLVAVSQVPKTSGSLPRTYSFVSTSNIAADVTALKQSETGDSLVLRVVNSKEHKLHDVKVRTNGLGTLGRTYETDLLEENKKRVQKKQCRNSFRTNVHGFGINTYLLETRGEATK